MFVQVTHRVHIPDTHEERVKVLNEVNRLEDTSDHIDDFNDADSGEFDASEWAGWALGHSLSSTDSRTLDLVNVEWYDDEVIDTPPLGQA